MQAMRYVAEVDSEGRVALPPLGLEEGTTIEVIVLVRDDEFASLAAAAESSLDFWNNPTDDALWNHA